MEGTVKFQLEVGENNCVIFSPSKFTDFPDLEPLLHKQRSRRIYTILEWGWVGWHKGKEQKEFLTFSNPILFDVLQEDCIHVFLVQKA